MDLGMGAAEAAALPGVVAAEGGAANRGRGLGWEFQDLPNPLAEGRAAEKAGPPSETETVQGVGVKSMRTEKVRSSSPMLGAKKK